MFGVGLGPGISAFIIPQQFIHVRVAGIGLVRALVFSVGGLGFRVLGLSNGFRIFALVQGTSL